MIRELRTSASLSQRKLAKRLGVDASYISHLESGRRDPSIELLRKLAKATNAPISLLIAGALETEVSEEKREPYNRILESLLELAKTRQLDLDFEDDPAA